MSKRMRRRLMFKQKLYGLLMLALCGLVLWMCSIGTTPEDQDATVILLIAPMGLYMLFSKHICIYG